MGLFWSSKELQFGTCTYGKPPASPIKQRKGNSFIEEEGRLREAIRNKMSIGGNWEFEI